MLLGDSDASVEDEDDAVNPEEEEEEEGTSGMQAPEDVVAHDHEDATPGESESDGSAPSSGMEDADLESDESGEEEEVQGYEGENGETKEPIEQEKPSSSVKVVGALGPKHKAYHTSPEWLQLLEFEKEKKVILSKIPNVIGAGVHRHPSKCFWTAIYPACSIKSCSWGASRTPLECLIKCIKHIIKQHLIAYPNSSEDSEWKSQLQSLSDLISSS